MAVGRLVTHTGRIVHDGGVGPETGPISVRFEMPVFPSLLSLDPLVTANLKSCCFKALVVFSIGVFHV